VARNDQIVRILMVAKGLAATRRGVSLKALAERLEVPWRSVYRDVAALERAGFPIERTESGHRLSAGWTAPNLPGIESDEILAFFAVRALTQAWRATALGRPLDRLWMKLTADRTGQGALLPLVHEPWFAVRSALAIDYRAHDKTIAVFEKAARDHLVVGSRYRALSTGQVTARQVETAELYWDPTLESLYVIGWCRLRNDVRVFALHRFMAASLTEETFRPRAEARSKAALKNAFRVWRGSNVETVRVRFSAGVATEIRERIWGPGQRIEDDETGGGGGVVLTMEVADGAEVERWILGFGAEAEVLAPARLRARVAEQIGRGAALYGDGAAGKGTGRRPAMKRPARPNRLARDDNGRR
jgi:predicted DNA-binding transcriptional regulator YafY